MLLLIALLAPRAGSFSVGSSPARRAAVVPRAAPHGSFDIAPRELLARLRAADAADGAAAGSAPTAAPFAGADLRALVERKWGAPAHALELRRTRVSSGATPSVYLCALGRAAGDGAAAASPRGGDADDELDALAALLVRWGRAPEFVAERIAACPSTPRVTATARYNAAVPLELEGDALAEATSAPDAPAREYVDYVRPERRSGKSRLGV